MLFPDQPLHIYRSPTQLLSVDRLVAGFASPCLLGFIGH